MISEKVCPLFYTNTLPKEQAMFVYSISFVSRRHALAQLLSEVEQEDDMRRPVSGSPGGRRQNGDKALAIGSFDFEPTRIPNKKVIARAVTNLHGDARSVGRSRTPFEDCYPRRLEVDWDGVAVNRTA